MSARWVPRLVIDIPFDPHQKQFYFQRDAACVYPQYPFREGRAKGSGEFSLVVARDYFMKQGFSVWVSEPRLNEKEYPGWTGFIAVSFQGKRRTGDEAYERIVGWFSRETLTKLNKEADAAKIRLTGNSAGGDPDLFVFKKTEGEKQHFFVEVKYKDKLRAKQEVTFPLIEKHLCEVRLAQLKEL